MLQIVNWDKLFENNRSREIVDPKWVPLPNRHDGASFGELMEHPEGPAHFAAWVLLVQVASRCGTAAPRCGDLRRGDGSPHTPRSLYLSTRCPEAVFKSAIPRLIELGWVRDMAKTDEKQQSVIGGAGIPQAGAAVPHQGAQNRIELNGKESLSLLSALCVSAYPKSRIMRGEREEISFTENDKRALESLLASRPGYPFLFAIRAEGKKTAIRDPRSFLANLPLLESLEPKIRAEFKRRATECVNMVKPLPVGDPEFDEIHRHVKGHPSYAAFIEKNFPTTQATP